LALHRQQDLAAVERIYLKVLDKEPRHFDSLHMLAVVALQRGRTERGIELIRQAIALNKKVAAKVGGWNRPTSAAAVGWVERSETHQWFR